MKEKRPIKIIETDEEYFGRVGGDMHHELPTPRKVEKPCLQENKKKKP